ncbi:hypothetical protein BGZ52_007336, partial [Haplosporangium bisporale]
HNQSNKKMFPKVLALLSVLALAVAVQAQDGPQILSARYRPTDPSLTKRDCVFGCHCNQAEAGKLVCAGNNVRQCAYNGGCCDYGYRKSCAQCGKLTCPTP